ncbi:MAG: toxin-antitoxin system protein [Clostridia bacterium]|nr:toxin-antitoxin system protein [Clostridia bacterium]
MKPLKVRISLTLDEDIVERMKCLAEEDDRSLSQYINLLLREHLRSREAENEAKS